MLHSLPYGHIFLGKGVQNCRRCANINLLREVCRDRVAASGPTRESDILNGSFFGNYGLL